MKKGWRQFLLSASCFQPHLLNQPLPSRPLQLKPLLLPSRMLKRCGQHRLDQVLKWIAFRVKRKCITRGFGGLANSA